MQALRRTIGEHGRPASAPPGLPVGLLAGRWAWALFAGMVGVAGTAEVPLPIVLLVIPVTLLLASLLAAGPGWAAARISPAAALRAE